MQAPKQLKRILPPSKVLSLKKYKPGSIITLLIEEPAEEDETLHASN